MSRFFSTELTTQQFLDQYWQQKPLLIRQAFSQFDSPISAEELAGLACEQGIESRLIEEFGVNGSWQLRHGPFDENDFTSLPATHWTLLVQDVDKHVPQLSHILQQFDFIPEWRRDDLMISFAPQGGSVGPHTDGYDVFLLQAEGTRRWQISDTPVTEAILLADVDLKILAHFEPDQTWELQPGDMLYLPPHFAHHGVALNDCMTFSIGFRAPTVAELMDAMVNTMLEQELGRAHYADPSLTLPIHLGQIDDAAIERVKQLLHQAVEDMSPYLARVMGQLVTETKSSLTELAESTYNGETCDGHDLASRFAAGEYLTRNPYQRYAWASDDDAGFLFYDGDTYQVAKTSIHGLAVLAESRELTQPQWQQLQHYPELVALLCQLIEAGGWSWSAD